MAVTRRIPLPPGGGAPTPKPTGGGAKATLWTQPQFDPRIRTIRQPTTGQVINLQRGGMIWDRSAGLPPGYGAPATVEFLYNPASVGVTYILQDSSIQSALQYPFPGDNAFLAIPLNQQVSFSLLFDRTYELGGGAGGDITKMGVDVDVRAMRQFTGQYIGDYSQQGIPGNAAVPTGAAGTISQGSVFQLVPAYLFLGQADAALKYYGYVDSWNVTYTHFTNLMLPMRCSIDVSFTMLPLGPGGDTSTAAGGPLLATQLQVGVGVGVIAGAGGGANPGAVGGR